MEWIEIREDSGRWDEASNRIGAVMRIDGYDYPLALAPPFDAEREGELDWYFEEHLRFPFTDEVRAQEAGASIVAYGEALFRQLVASDEAREAYGKLKDRAYPLDLSVSIIGSPAFQALHWEALKDPRLPKPFALDVPMVRRRLASPPPVEALQTDSPTLNLLVITARPGEAYDVGYRTITRPLVAMLRQAQLRVKVDFVRPGTWQALAGQLEAAMRDGRRYHAIHFDLHGGLLTYEEFKACEEKSPPVDHLTLTPADRLTMRGRWGRADIEPYDGVKAFLSFQPTADDPSGLGEASELAALLLKHRIPVAILNACQSGKQVGAQESSLAARLLEAGLHSVLGMAWSVTVSAAERLIPTLYGELFAGRPIGAAVLAGRGALAADKSRRAAYNETIALEDWLLPVAYQNREPKLAFREFTDAEAKAWFGGRAARFPDVAPEYGFFGRDLDILRIETALLTPRKLSQNEPARCANLLLVLGMGGSGKTTLLKHLAHWWELTGLTAKSFYFGWDERAYTRAQILRTLAPAVLPDDERRAFDLLDEAAQLEAVAAALRSKRHLLILDNLESVTAAPLAIPHSLGEKEREELRTFLAALAGGQTLVLCGSRAEELWLAKGTFADNVHVLAGLDPEAASDLADAVLDRARARSVREELAFKDLMALLAGYPLALQVVLPNLAQKTAAAVLADLQQGFAGIDTAPGADPVAARTQNLMACIDYSHGHLDPGAQALLLCFAPFTGVINAGADFLKGYQEALAAEPALADLPLDRLGEVLERARGLGLVQRDAQIPVFLRPQPALSWFLTNRLAAADAAERRPAIKSAFRKLYDGVAGALFRLQQSKEPMQRRRGEFLAEQEYANLGTALRFALDQHAPILEPYRVLSGHLDYLEDHRRGLALGDLVLERLEQLPPEAFAGNHGVELAIIMDDIASRQLLLKQFEAARASYEKALAIHDGLQEADPKGRATILYQLGIVAQEQRRFPEAEVAYRKALEIFVEFNDLGRAASGYHQLGTVAQQQQRFLEAEAAYKKALEILIDVNDRQGAALTCYQLGMLAQEQRHFADAEISYLKALEIYVEFDEPGGAAMTFRQLGTLKLEQSRFAEAEAEFKEALKIDIAFNNRHGAATTYHQLGRVAEEQGRFQDAEAAYKKALGILVDYDESLSVVIVLRSFARLWKASTSPSIPASVATILKVSVNKSKSLLTFLNMSSDEAKALIEATSQAPEPQPPPQNF